MMNETKTFHVHKIKRVENNIYETHNSHTKFKKYLHIFAFKNLIES